MTSYNALLEFAGVDFTPDLGDSIVDDLRAYHVAVSGGPGRVAARITFPAENLEQAFTTAVSVVRHTLTRWNADLHPVLEVAEVLTEAEFNRREGWDDVPELVGIPDAAEILGVSRQRMLQLVDASRFVSVQRVGERTIVLSRDEVMKYRDGAVHATEE